MLIIAPLRPPSIEPSTGPFMTQSAGIATAGPTSATASVESSSGSHGGHSVAIDGERAPSGERQPQQVATNSASAIKQTRGHGEKCAQNGIIRRYAFIAQYGVIELRAPFAEPRRAVSLA